MLVCFWNDLGISRAVWSQEEGGGGKAGGDGDEEERERERTVIYRTSFH